MSDSRLATLDHDSTSSTLQTTITAVDVVLEPDAIMIQQAQAANAALLKNFPKGYAVMGVYVYTASWDKLFTAAAKVLASEKVTSWKLKAFKYYYIPLKEIGLGGILVEPTADMIRLQKELIDAAAPFMAPAISGTAAAFATTLKGPEINQPTIDAVANYLSGHTGEHYSPHVTIGVGTRDYLDALLAAPFPMFTFSVMGESAHQFGNFGIAAKRLHSFKLS